jgi:RNA polymerase sigma-70 factor, ECF subfamily
LLLAVARGDDNAFAAFYDTVAAPVFGLALRVLRNRALAEEVTQEVMVELWSTAPRYDPRLGNALNWSLTVAHRRSVDRVRSTQSSSDRENRFGTASTERPFDEVTEAVTVSMERQQVRRCLAGLTDLQRQSVLLAYYEGLTHREVSERLDVPLGTVKTRLRDGLIRLRDCLGRAP